MDTKEKYTWKVESTEANNSFEGQLGESVLVINIEDYPSTDKLNVGFGNLNFELTTRDGKEDKIWGFSSENSSGNFYYSVPLEMRESWCYQAMNELAGCWVNNQVLDEKHKIFFAYSGQQVYKSSQITHPVSLDKYKKNFGFDFDSTMAANQKDLIFLVLIEKVVNGIDANPGGYCVNSDNCVQRIDKEGYYTWRRGDGYSDSLNGNISDVAVFGIDLVIQRDLDQCEEKLIKLGSKPKDLESNMDKFIEQFCDEVLWGSSWHGRLKQVKREIMYIFTRRFNREFIEKCKLRVLELATAEKSRKHQLLLTSGLN